MTPAWLEKLPERIKRRIAAPDAKGCMRWLAAKGTGGYGQAGLGGSLGSTTAHRAVYLLAVGAIPEGLECDHLCRVRDCVNPEHIELVTRTENIRRSAPATATHCKRGHPYSGDNLGVQYSGRRRCNACNRENKRLASIRYRARLRASRVVGPDGEAVTP